MENKKPSPTPTETPKAASKPLETKVQEKAKKKTKGLFNWISSLSIQSKILAMLLAASLGSAALIGYFASSSTSAAINQEVSNKLEQVRDSRMRDLQTKYQDLETNSIVLSRTPLVGSALKDFETGYNELADKTIDATQQKSIDDFYTNVFIPRLDKNTPTTEKFSASSFEPTTNQAKYLQANYTAKSTNENVDQSNTLDNAGDDSTWTKANAKYNNYFREVVNRYGYEDLSLVDTAGNVVYTTYKGVDLGTNAFNGQYFDSTLSKQFQDVLHMNSGDTAQMTDFVTYYPSYGIPTSFMVSPIAENGKNIGLLILHSSSNEVTDIMTSDKHWKEAGLGETGEAYLVGQDGLMRSNSRLLMEHPDEYVKDSTKANSMTKENAELAVKTGTSVLLQKIDDQANTLAGQGQTGVMMSKGYTGGDSLTAYAPVKVQNLQWNMIVDEGADEAFAPVTNFQKKLAASTAGLILLMSLGSLLLSRAFTKPLQKMTQQVKKVSKGDYSSDVDIKSKDEFGDLATSFNNMSRSLRAKDALIQEQEIENRKILSEMMPEDLVEGYNKGDSSLTLNHNNATIMYADLEGLRTASEGSPYEAANKLLTSFDETAARHGVERVRTMANGYLVSCGLQVQRVDHTKRVVDFALEIEDIVKNFNRQHDTDLDLRIGIDTGSVSSGLVGKRNLSYDLWGDAVKMAHTIQTQAKGKGIFTTTSVKDRLHAGYTFTEAGDIETGHGHEEIWEITENTK